MPHGESPTPTQTTGEGSSPTVAHTEAHQVATDKCERALELYRNGRISRQQAVIAFTKNLSDPGLGLSPESIGSALASYVDHLGEFADSAAHAGGSSGGPPDVGTWEVAPPGEDPDAAETLQLAGECDREDDKTSPPRRPHRRRRREKAPARSSDGSSSEDEPGRSRKKHADPSLYAWSKNREAFDATLSPELRATLALQRNYAEDPRQAIVDVLNSPGVPEFPASEWLNLFKGNPVDLNRVLTGRYSLAWDEKQSEQLGDFEISQRSLVPSKPVQTAGDWVIAWQQTSTAISYAFPHRHDEVVKYNEHVLSLFAAISPSLHQRILDYDRAVRKRVAATRHVRLTDVADFVDLRLQFLESAGANASTAERKAASRNGQTRPAGRRPRDRDPNEICRRYNAGVDHGPVGDCPYRHACLSCGTAGHPKSECPKTKGRSA